MEIANFKGVVSWREVTDSNGSKRWLVIYGLRVRTCYDFREARGEFNDCVDHAASCEGYYD
jgi:hypothetical protein